MNRRSPGRPTLLVETSAILAVLLQESDGETFAESMEAAECVTTATIVFEATLGLTKQRAHAPKHALTLVEMFVQSMDIEVVSFTPEMLPYAVAARERYGRGRKRLNMGDCLSYAAAKQLGLKLLYKGDDFVRTDVNG
jgi:ribonuclease VapC